MSQSDPLCNYLFLDKRNGYATPRRIRDAWVEFVDRKDAKRMQMMYHNTLISERGPWSCYMWTIQYLKGFTWDNLHEMKILRDLETRKLLDAEVAAVNQQNAFYLEQSAADRNFIRSMSERNKKPLSNAFKPPLNNH